MCFYSNGAELKKTNIRVENPMFAFSSDSKGQEFRDLYLMDLNPKTKEPLAGKSWLCSSCEFIKVEQGFFSSESVKTVKKRPEFLLFLF